MKVGRVSLEIYWGDGNGFAITDSVWAVMKSIIFFDKMESEVAKIRTASKPAFLAPAAPMARVATGMPPGI